MTNFRNFNQYVLQKYFPDEYIRKLENIIASQEVEIHRLRESNRVMESLIPIPRVIREEDPCKVPNQKDGVIYFIEMEGTPYVKIGHTTNVSLRLGSLQTGNPQNLKLLGYIPGKCKLEKAFHHHYQNYKTDCLGGKEWFCNPPLRFEDEQ